MARITRYTTGSWTTSQASWSFTSSHLNQHGDPRSGSIPAEGLFTPSGSDPGMASSASVTPAKFGNMIGLLQKISFTSSIENSMGSGSGMGYGLNTEIFTMSAVNFLTSSGGSPVPGKDMFGGVSTEDNSIDLYDIINLDLASRGKPLLESSLFIPTFGKVFTQPTISVIAGLDETGNYRVYSTQSMGAPTNTTFFFASSSGKVGILTDTPTEDFHVGGSIKATGNITASGEISASLTIKALKMSVPGIVDLKTAIDTNTAKVTYGDEDAVNLMVNYLALEGEALPITPFSKTLLDDDDQATWLATLGLGDQEAGGDNEKGPKEGSTDLVTVGAVDAGSITSGFTSVDVGAGTLQTTGILRGGNVTASGEISASGAIYAADYYASGQKVRPNLYWFANCDAATYSPASDGSFPSTNTTDVSFSPTYNSNAAVFTWSAEELTITRAGIYQFTYNVTLETGANGSASNRTGGGIALLKGGVVVNGTEAYVYCRMATPQTEKNTGTISVMLDVAVDDVFKIVFIRTGATNASSKLGTITAGTAWTIEAVT